MKTYYISVVALFLLLVGAQRTMATDFFDGVVSGDLEIAMKKANDKKMPIFMVIYDAKNPTKSKLDYSLGYFLQYKKTKDFVRKNFVQVLVKSSSRGVAQYIPKDEPLENCLVVVLSPDGKALVTEGVYANPDVALKKVGEYLEKWEKVKKEQGQQEEQVKPGLPTTPPTVP